MNTVQLKEHITKVIPGLTVLETKQYPEIEVSAAMLHSTAITLKNSPELSFDYLFCLTGVDLPESFMVLYHLESTQHRHALVLKVRTTGRENAEIDTVEDVWTTAGFHEREIYDLLGVRFKNHPDLRRLFLDDNWGYPLRKDYRDEINIIER